MQPTTLVPVTVVIFVANAEHGCQELLGPRTKNEKPGEFREQAPPGPPRRTQCPRLHGGLSLPGKRRRVARTMSGSIIVGGCRCIRGDRSNRPDRKSVV